MSERSSTTRKSSDSISLRPRSIFNHESIGLELLDRVTSCRDIAHTLGLKETSSNDHPPSSQDPLVLEHENPPQDMDMEREHLLSGRTSTPPTRSKERYAKIELIAPFFPNADPSNEKQEQSWRVRMSRRSTMLLIQTLVALITCLCNIAFTAWAYTTHPPQRGVGTLSLRDHKSAAQINRAAHIILNVLSSLFLGAGNYCMQVLAAPSAESIQACHSGGDHLDIGVQSLRNLRSAPKSQRVLWVALVTISLLLHLL
jgi:hypothetical protein